MKTFPLGTILVIGGALLLTFGIMAADSFASAFSKLFTGNPTDKAVFLIIAGAVALGVGMVMTLRTPRK